MASPLYAAPLRPVSRREPCPICGKPSWCELREDGAVHCMREESPTPANRAGGWWHNLPRRRAAPQRGVATPAPRLSSPAAAATQRADVATLDAVYRRVLAASPPADADRRYLQACGLQADQLDGYGTIRAGAAGALGFPDEVLRTVPGLTRQGGSWALCLRSGLLVASYDPAGRVQALRVRVPLPGGGKVYKWLSGGEGPSSGAPATLRRPAAVRDRTTLYITEGEKKAHLAALRTGCPAIGIPGIGCWAGAEPALRQLRGEGCYRVIVALDEDSEEKTRQSVERCRREIVGLAVRLGFAVEVARWDGELGKGIDDLPAGYIPASSPALPEAPIAGAATTDEGTDAALGRRTRDIMRSQVSPAKKWALIAYAIRYGPGEQARTVFYPALADVAGPPRDALVGAGMSEDDADKAIAARAKRLGQEFLDLEELEYVDRAEEPDKKSGHPRVSLAPRYPRLAAVTLTLPRPTRKEQDAKRKRRCMSCGSPVLVLRCMACGEVQEGALAAIAASGEPVIVADAPAPKRAPLFDVEAPAARKFIRGGLSYEKRERDREYAQYVAAEADEEAAMEEEPSRTPFPESGNGGAGGAAGGRLEAASPVVYSAESGVAPPLQPRPWDGDRAQEAIDAWLARVTAAAAGVPPDRAPPLDGSAVDAACEALDLAGLLVACEASARAFLAALARSA